MEINGQDLEYGSDPALRATIDEQAGQTNRSIADRYDSGLSAGRGLLNANDGFDHSVGYGNQAQTDAIRSRYMPSYRRQESALKIENMKNAQTDHIRNLDIATKAANQEIEMNKQKALLKWKIEQQNRKARGQSLGNVLGIVGGVVGAVYGGPMGAAAGYGAGTGVGNAVGSS